MNMKRFLAIALSLCMLLSMMPLSAFAVEDETMDVLDVAIEQLDGSDYDINLMKETDSENMVEVQEFADDENVKVIIVMEEASIIEEDTSAVLDDETMEKVEQMQAIQENVVAEIEETVLEGESLEVSYNYTWLLNAVSAQVPYGSISAIREVEGVKQVLLQRSYSVCESEVTAADILTNNDGVMIGRESTWAEGYTGEGMTIAIIDTGLDVDHQNFQALDEDVDTAFSAEDINEKLGSLNASSLYSGLTIDDVYYNTKVVYGFNYVDENVDVTHDNDGQGDHGTHVAGIAAANKVEGSEAVGVAPDAQLMVMKVFGQNGGAYDEDILAALEDAMMLGADVINMSLGSPAGFTTSDDVDMSQYYDRVAETNIVLTISAGNNYDAGYANNWGTDANQTINPDNAVVGAPGTYANVLSVASVENVAYLANYIDVDGYRIGYSDSGPDYGHDALTTLTGEYQVVAVPNLGDVSDFGGLNLEGKVALIQRGTINFYTKCDNAAAAGAVGCIIYNNTSGELGLNLEGGTSTIPCVAITLSNGSYLLSALAENPELTISFPAEEGEVANENAYDMSSFSSWGPAPDLTLEPDITAPGGNIYSTLMNGEYGVMSGTSMSAPNLAGMSALVMQYVKANFDDETTDYRTLVRDLLMSTSVPLTDDDTGLLYSPRYQGSGLANVYNAVATRAYLTVDGSDTAKAELGDDDDRTGVYDYTFDVHNFGETDLFYAVSTNAQTEGVVSYGSGSDGYDFMSGTGVELSAAISNTSSAMVLAYDVDGDGVTGSHDAYWISQAAQGDALDEDWNAVAFRYDADGDDGVDEDDVQAYLDALVGNDSAADLEQTVLKVEAGETVSVDVNVTLSQADKDYLDIYYTNGGYVEGFTCLTAKTSGAVDLSLPYLGFYGDWAEAPVLDEEVYHWDMLNDGVAGSQYFHALITDLGDSGSYYLGYNLYVDEEVDPAHMSVSPDGNGYLDNVSDIYVSLLRNAATLTVTYTDAETGEVYYTNTAANASKSCYSSSNGMVIPYVYSWYNEEMYDFAGLPNNTKVDLTVEVVGVAENDEPETLCFPITVDLEAPELTEAKIMVDVTTGQRYLRLNFTENVSTAVVGLLSADGSALYYMDSVEDVEEDENGYQNNTVTINVTNVPDKVMLVLGDYALNEVYYGLNLNGEGGDYSELVSYQYNVYDATSGWVSFGTDVYYDETVLFADDASVVCAEYVNGYVFAQTDDGKLYGFPYADMLNDTLILESTYVAQLDNVYQDLAYSYADGKLYGLLTTQEEWYGSVNTTSEIYSININGEYYDPDMYQTVAPYQEDWVASRGSLYGLALACDDESNIYILGNYIEEVYDEETGESTYEESTAQLWVSGMESSRWGDSRGAFKLVGDTGLGMDYLQSMAWDHNTETLYWARFDVEGLSVASELYELDVTETTDEETGEITTVLNCTKLGELSGETNGLFAPLSDEAAAKEVHANVPTMDADEIGTPILCDSVVTMNVNSTKDLSYDMDPWYTTHKSVVWSSDDESVAVVDQNGTVTAVGTGSAVITVANAEDESKYDTVSIEVTALDLVIEGVISAQTAGVGSTTGTSTYKFEMVEGVAEFGTINAITASDELNFGLDLGTSVAARGSIWASEYGNTGMIYEIDADTGEVLDVLQPIDGDMLFGMTYNEELDTFAGIMNMNLYVDLELTHEEQEEMKNSYDPELYEFTYHKINMLDYLIAANDGFVTGENGQGASSEIVFSGITTIAESYYYEDTYKDYTGNWASSEMGNYISDQTLVLLDNVGRLWYIDEITGMSKVSDEYGNSFYTSADGETVLMGGRDGLFDVELSENEDGSVNCSVFYLRQIVETSLTDMFREGTMPRITYHFSDIEYAGETEDGAPMYIMSLYDYWNDGTTNELYLYIPGVGTGEYEVNPDTWMSEEVMTASRLYYLGNTGENNIIASVHSAEVTGGVEEEEEPEHVHDFKLAETVEATCTEDGYEKYTCSCGEEKLLILKAEGHKWDEGKVTTEPTQTTEGVKTYTCTVCGETKTESIERLPVEPDQDCDGGENCPSCAYADLKADLTKDSWWHEATDYVISEGLMIGDNGVWNRKGEITRAMVVQILYRLAGEPEVTGTENFTDVDNQWYAKVVTWAANNGIVNGYADGTFQANKAVTREEMVTMFARFAKFMGMDVTGDADLSKFSDAKDVHDYAEPAMKWAVAVGLVAGNEDGTLAPRAGATRQEMATIVMRWCEEIAK